MRVLAAVFAAALIFAAPAGSQLTSGLRGVVRVPLPVCMQDEPCSRPAPGIKLAFTRNGHVAARVTSGAAGRYRVALASGTYVVTSSSGIGPKTFAKPARVRVLAATFRRVDFFVDTGIRAS